MNTLLSKANSSLILLDSSQALNFRRVDVKFGQVESEPAKLWLDSLACESCLDFCLRFSYPLNTQWDLVLFTHKTI